MKRKPTEKEIELMIELYLCGIRGGRSSEEASYRAFGEAESKRFRRLLDSDDYFSRVSEAWNAGAEKRAENKAERDRVSERARARKQQKQQLDRAGQFVAAG